MKITYIGHSGYLVEMKNCYCLFDYYTGKLPQLADKPVFVFVSHGHQDHYNPWIFSLAEQYASVCFVLPPDVKANPGKVPVLDKEQCTRLKEEGCIAMHRSWIYRLKARQEYAIAMGDVTLQIRTLRSTDAGVAYLVKQQEATIFHVGDLNWWHWESIHCQKWKSMWHFCR